MAHYRRKTTGSIGGCVSAVVLMAAVIGCARDTEPESTRTTSQAQSVATSFAAFEEARDSGVALWATEWLEIGDRVHVTSSGQFGGVANSGPGVVRVGVEARVGEVWAAGPVDLRDRATVAGDIHLGASSTLTKGNGVTTGAVSSDDLGSVADIWGVPPALEPRNESVHLEPHTSHEIIPGRYNDLTLKAGTKLLLFPGDYSFGTVHVEPGAELYTTETCLPVRIWVRSGLYFKGRIVTPPDGAQRIGLAYEGTQTAHIEAPFVGSIMAPNAELILNSSRHEGTFWARKLRVQSGAKIVHVEPLQCSSSPALARPAAPEPVDIGAAPQLGGAEDLDTFLSWFYRIRAAEVEAARERIAQVSRFCSVAEAAAVRFAQHRQARNLAHALMDLYFISALESDCAESFLIGLLQQPLGYPESSLFRGGASTRYTDEVAYRKRALLSLSQRHTAAASAAVRGVALSHTDHRVRGAAIQILAAGMSSAERAAFRAELPTHDHFFLDRPDMSTSDFEARYGNMLSQYRTD